MPRVYQRKRPYRTIFRKLSRGALYWLSTDLTVQPFVKTSRSGYLGGWNTATGAPTITAQSPTNAAVVRVPQQFVGQNTVLG